MYSIYLFMILITISISAAEIIITNDFELIQMKCLELDSNSLVLFDVDGTLIMPCDAILKPQSKELFEELVANFADRDLFREIRMKAPHELVDDRSVNFIQRLQLLNIPVIAFTAAPARVCGKGELGVWRVEELRRYGFDFSSSFPLLNFLELSKYSNQQHMPLFKLGVLYSSFHPKGEILVQFLKQLGFNPKKVIFIDDELQHVYSVVASLDELGIPCLGIHYTVAQLSSCNLNTERARLQINYFIEHDIWLTDEETDNE